MKWDNKPEELTPLKPTGSPVLLPEPQEFPAQVSNYKDRAEALKKRLKKLGWRHEGFYTIIGRSASHEFGDKFVNESTNEKIFVNGLTIFKMELRFQ